MAIFGAVLFDQPDQAEAAKAVLEREGYAVDAQGQEDGSVVLVVTPPPAVTDAALRARLELLASELGGEYIGHGGSTQIPLDMVDVDMSDLHRGRD